jgi:nucleoid-associated protein YgaU
MAGDIADASTNGLSAGDAYDPLGATAAAPATDPPQSARRAPALLGQAAANDAMVEPVAAEGYSNPPQPSYGRNPGAQATASTPPRHGMYGAGSAQQSASPSAAASRSSASDLSQAGAYDTTGTGFGQRPAATRPTPPAYDPPASRQPVNQFAQGFGAQPPAVRQSPLQQEPLEELGPDRRYVVQPNDNYWSISQRVFGTGAFFKAILQHERDRGRHIDEQLQPGEVLTIPPAELLVKTYPHLCPRQPIPSSAATQMVQVSAPRRNFGGRGTYYVVEDGDTLFDIARYELGKAARWVEIYDLNRDQIGEDFDNLKPGLQLVLPTDGLPESVTRAPAGGLQR